MAKNIDFMGATFPDVPSIQLPQHEGGLVSFDDTSDGTIIESDVAQGKIGYANGQRIVGTAVPSIPTIEALSVTENGTYTAPSGVDGYSPVIVDVTGGGYELIYSDDISVQCSSTSMVKKGDISVPKAVGKDVFYIRIRDTSGEYANRYYGSDQIYFHTLKDSEFSILNTVLWYYTGARYYGTTGSYGVFLREDTNYSLSNSGVIQLYARYSSSMTKTINSTYRIEIYALAMPPET